MPKYTMYYRLNDPLSQWSIYFPDISYHSGIKFLQAMNNVINVEFKMRKDNTLEL